MSQPVRTKTATLRSELQAPGGQRTRAWVSKPREAIQHTADRMADAALAGRTTPQHDQHLITASLGLATDPATSLMRRLIAHELAHVIQQSRDLSLANGADTVELNNNAFPAATGLRIGQRPPAVRMVSHEIGHAIDLRVLERAWQAHNNAGQTAATRRTLLAVRSPSGSRWGRQAGSTADEIQENAGDSSPAFRAAVQRDGVRRDTSGSRTTPEGTTATLSGGITTYSDTDYQELYAESFAMYVAAPRTLEQLRPATYAYFRSQFP